MRILILLLLGIFFIPSPVISAVARFGDFDRYEFSPSRKEQLEVRFSIDEQASVTISIYSPDDEIVRRLVSPQSFAAGEHEVNWDGKDDQGDVVPDEAYLPVLTAKFASGATLTLDSRAWSGGESLDKADSLKTERNGVIFQLEKPARILGRVGIHNGPMLNEIVTWKPFPKGRIFLPWDGFDGDDLINVRESKRYSILLAGFELPQHSIITTGNKETDYLAYRKARNWPLPQRDFSKEPAERNGHRISPHYYRARALDIAPRTKLSLLDTAKDKLGNHRIDGPVLVKVDANADDKWALETGGYEVSFFLDGEFVAEEEQGYLPLSWKWLPADLAPGRHVLTVNLVGFKGQIGVKSIPLIVEK